MSQGSINVKYDPDYCTVLGENGFTGIVSHQLRDLCIYQISGELIRQFRSYEALVLQNYLPQTFHQFWQHQEWLTTMVFFVHIGPAISEWLAPSSDHTVAHDVGSVHMAQLAVDLCLILLLSMQKSDNCRTLTVCRKNIIIIFF